MGWTTWWKHLSIGTSPCLSAAEEQNKHQSVSVKPPHHFRTPTTTTTTCLVLQHLQSDPHSWKWKQAPLLLSSSVPSVLLGGGLSHPPLHYHLISGLQTGPPPILAPTSIRPLITAERRILPPLKAHCVFYRPLLCVHVCVHVWWHACAYKWCSFILPSVDCWQ